MYLPTHTTHTRGSYSWCALAAISRSAASDTHTAPSAARFAPPHLLTLSRRRGFCCTGSSTRALPLTCAQHLCCAHLRCGRAFRARSPLSTLHAQSAAPAARAASPEGGGMPTCYAWQRLYLAARFAASASWAACTYPSGRAGSRWRWARAASTTLRLRGASPPIPQFHRTPLPTTSAHTHTPTTLHTTFHAHLPSTFYPPATFAHTHTYHHTSPSAMPPRWDPPPQPTFTATRPSQARQCPGPTQAHYPQPTPISHDCQHPSHTTFPCRTRTPHIFSTHLQHCCHLSPYTQDYLMSARLPCFMLPGCRIFLLPHCSFFFFLHCHTRHSPLHMATPP